MVCGTGILDHTVICSQEKFVVASAIPPLESQQQLQPAPVQSQMSLPLVPMPLAWQWEMQPQPQLIAVQMAPMQMFQVPLMAPGLEDGIWQAAAAQAPLQGQSWESRSAEEEDRREGAFLSDSTRRRLRRQRAAKRRSEADPADLLPAAGALRDEFGVSHSDEEPGSSTASETVQEEVVEAAWALDLPQGGLAQLAFERQGCRRVQDAIHRADPDLTERLLAEMKGHVREAVVSPNANYVVQAIITALPSSMSGFVARELLGAGAKTARHRFGCRILQRLVEHCGTNSDVAELLQEVLKETEDLCRHTFGHFVIESLLEHQPEHRARIIGALLEDLHQNSCHRCAAHVVEAALTHCSTKECMALETGLMDKDLLVCVAQHQHGYVALRGLLRQPEKAAAVRHLLRHTATSLWCSKRSLQLLQELGLSTTKGA